MFADDGQTEIYFRLLRKSTELTYIFKLSFFFRARAFFGARLFSPDGRRALDFFSDNLTPKLEQFVLVVAGGKIN